MEYSFPALIDDFEIQVSESGRVQCVGTLDTPDAYDELSVALMDFHDAVLDAGLTAISLDLTGMSYMNSSAIKAFLVWFCKVEAGRDKRYQIEVNYDPARSWQLVSLRAMERLAPAVITLKPANG